MKKFLSYLWPNTKRFHSEINGTLEVTYINGKKVLDTQNANYSYGSLQKILEYGLTKVDLKPIKNLLLLGMGGGSIIKSLRETFEYQNNIIAIEIDPKVIELAKVEFDISDSKKLQMLNVDAFQFVKDSNERFQLVIIDLFIDTEVPSIFYGSAFCKNVGKIIDTDGCVIFNIGINLIKDSKTSQNIIANFGDSFVFQIHPKVNGTNTLLLGKKTK